MGGVIKIVGASGFIDGCIISDNGRENIIYPEEGLVIDNSVGDDITKFNSPKYFSTMVGGICSSGKYSKNYIADSTIAHNACRFAGGISPLANTLFVLHYSYSYWQSC